MNLAVQTIAVTGADGQVGRALLDQLRGTSAKTIGLTRRPVNLPASKMISGLLESADAQQAMREADVLVHLAGTLRPMGQNSYQAANVRTTEAVIRAVKEGKPSRILYLSYVGADERSTNTYLRTKATAERILQEMGREVVVFRCTHIIGSPNDPGPTARAMLAKPGKAAGVLGSGGQIVAPIYRGNVVSALLSAMETGHVGIYDLAGPDRMTMDDLVRIINRNQSVRISHIPAWVARLLGLVVPALPSPMVDLLLRDSVGDSTRAVQAFRLTLTSLRTVWA